MATIVNLENVLRSPDFPRGEDRPEGGRPPLVFPRGSELLTTLFGPAGASDLSLTSDPGMANP